MISLSCLTAKLHVSTLILGPRPSLLHHWGVRVVDFRLLHRLEDIVEGGGFVQEGLRGQPQPESVQQGPRPEGVVVWQTMIAVPEPRSGRDVSGIQNRELLMWLK